MIGGDSPGHSATDIHRRHQVIDVDDPSLELYHQHDSRRRVPRDDIDHAPVAVAGERDLGEREPAPDLLEPAERGLVHQRVSSIDQAVKIGASPPEESFESGVENARHAPNVAERDLVESTCFDPHHRAARDPCGSCDVRLTQPTSKPKRPECRANALVIHGGSFGADPYLGLTGVDLSHDRPVERPKWPRLHRQCGADADREVRWGARGHAGGRAGRRRDPGRGRAGGSAGRDADRRGPHGPGSAGRGRSGAGSPGGAASRASGRDERDDDQPRLRLGAQVDHARCRGDQGRRRRDRGRRRHGIDEPGAVSAARRPVRLPARQQRAGRRRDRGRPLVHGRELPHGHPRRARRDRQPRQPRRPGCVRSRVASAGDRGDRRRPLR